MSGGGRAGAGTKGVGEWTVPWAKWCVLDLKIKAGDCRWVSE